MAVRYFIYEGFQFRTIDIDRTSSDLTNTRLAGTGNIAVTVLEDVVAALTDTGAFTQILGTADDATSRLNALTGYWTDAQGGADGGSIQEVRRLVLNETAPFVENPVYDVDETRRIPANQRNIHAAADRWILPPGLDQIIPIPAASRAPIGGIRFTLINSLIYDHTNLAKFNTAPEAWRAFNNYFLTRGLGIETTESRETYFVNPDLEAIVE